MRREATNHRKIPVGGLQPPHVRRLRGSSSLLPFGFSADVVLMFAFVAHTSDFILERV